MAEHHARAAFVTPAASLRVERTAQKLFVDVAFDSVGHVFHHSHAQCATCSQEMFAPSSESESVLAEAYAATPTCVFDFAFGLHSCSPILCESEGELEMSACAWIPGWVFFTGAKRNFENCADQLSSQALQVAREEAQELQQAQLRLDSGLKFLKGIVFNGAKSFKDLVLRKHAEARRILGASDADSQKHGARSCKQFQIRLSSEASFDVMHSVDVPQRRCVRAA